MKNYLEYKGYTGSVEFSNDDNCLFGSVQGIKSLISYEGSSVEELKKSFEYMVDNYLADCEAENIEPEKSYKGSLNIRIGSDIHRILALQAKSENITINAYIKDILEQYIKNCTNGIKSFRQSKTLN